MSSEKSFNGNFTIDIQYMTLLYNRKLFVELYLCMCVGMVSDGAID